MLWPVIYGAVALGILVLLALSFRSWFASYTASDWSDALAKERCWVQRKDTRDLHDPVITLVEATLHMDQGYQFAHLILTSEELAVLKLFSLDRYAKVSTARVIPLQSIQAVQAVRTAASARPVLVLWQTTRKMQFRWRFFVKDADFWATEIENARKVAAAKAQSSSR